MKYRISHDDYHDATVHILVIIFPYGIVNMVFHVFGISSFIFSSFHETMTNKHTLNVEFIHRNELVSLNNITKVRKN
jgi:hypothetical protein